MELTLAPLLLALPWLGVLIFVVFVTRLPKELPAVPDWGEAGAPLVSVIVPARNEAVNIETCVRSLTSSSYPAFEVIVVDDRSEDDTAALAGGVGEGNAARLEVVEGERLPDGWVGKPWACWQGAKAAKGELLLFTDADTTHGPELLSRAIGGLREERADLLTVLGRQLMESFWERLVQPQVFLTMLFRFPDFARTAANDRWRDAIANGQFILMPRTSYEAVGGHEAVRDEVVEDLRLAQVVKKSGLRLRIRRAEDDLATRMYRSLPQLVEGWSKNIVIGGLQSVPPFFRPVLPTLAFLGGIGLWLLPPTCAVLALLGVGGPGFLIWALTTCGLSVVVWAYFTRQMGAPAAYGLLYPLGAAAGTWIFLRSWIRGTNVEWKGRRYTVRGASELA
jgi:chlorobactene glucosyltransferase